MKAETLFFLDALDFRQDLGIRQNTYYPPIIAVSHFTKVFSLQNFVSYGNIPIYLAAIWYQFLFLPVKFSYSIDSTLLVSALFIATGCFCLAYNKP